ncbi:putative FMN-binding domain-containing protein [Pyrenochaeta sp. MPI-SDFR-AT-0127]|nr:putative FMN-binding domain-containing protein [Pyrenochaeta sp. MPI-SDFR-AT-0127]
MPSATGIGWKPKFAESDLTVLHDLIRDHPLSILITHIPHELTFNDAPIPLLQATYIPLHLDISTEKLGVLRGHIARGSPHAKTLIDALYRQSLNTSQHEDGDNRDEQILDHEVMIMFSSPAQSYVTPSFYTHTKPLSGKVAPTWFYTAVQVYGTLKLYHSSTDPSTKDFLIHQTTDLTKHAEEHLMSFPEEQAWKVSDAPKSFVDMLVPAIVGVEIEIKRIEGHTKAGQAVPALDQMGTIRGFEALGTDAGRAMASSIRRDMERNEKRVHVLREESAKGLVRGEKVKGRFGWYYPAVRRSDELKMSSADLMRYGLLVLLALSLFLHVWLWVSR